MKHWVMMNMLLLVGSIFAFSQPYSGEKLSRGLIGIPTEEGMYFSWRMTLEDAAGLQFDLYRSSNGGAEVKLNKEPIDRTSDFLDRTVDYTVDNRWTLKATTGEVATWTRLKGEERNPYLSIPICKPEDGEIAGESFTYTANDCSVGDLDGDGEYEIILKWSPSNSKRPPQRGFTGNTYLDAYKMDGTRLWRIDLGPNVRSGAATTNFLVFDFDGDGCAEICCKTGDGTVDGLGHRIGDAQVDWRTWDKKSPTYGKIVNGPEYLTVFEGRTGKELDSKEYIPTRYPLDGWVGVGGMVRGWYGRTVVAAWTFTNGALKHTWTFDSAAPGWETYSGMGNHSVTVADFDGDGCDEICVGAMTVDHDGKGLFTTGLRHGDALHAGRFIPSRQGMQVFGVHENEGDNEIVKRTPAVAMFDGATGEIIWQDGLGQDAGRGVAADIDPRYDGAECWCNIGGLRRGDTGEIICNRKPDSCNFTIYWDADPLAELLDHVSISKWNWNAESTDLLLKAEGVVSNNGTKGNPCLSGDILGDWREEVIWASEDQTELRIYSTTIPAVDRRATWMNDRQYRLAIAWQNVAYNQPPHPSF